MHVDVANEIIENEKMMMREKNDSHFRLSLSAD